MPAMEGPRTRICLRETCQTGIFFSMALALHLFTVGICACIVLMYTVATYVDGTVLLNT